MKATRLFPLIAALFLFQTPQTTAADWTNFRGPDGGIAEGKNLPVAWSAENNIAWKAELPGPGTSSPIVVGNKIFLTSYSGYAEDRTAKDPGDIKNLKRHVICLNRADGKIAWSKTIAAEQPEE